MSENLTLLVDSAEKLFTALAARCDEPAQALWPEVEASGFADILSPGFGGDHEDAFAIARLAGATALPVPLVEAMITAAHGWTPGQPAEGAALHLGALLRTAQIAGALDAALAMSIAHANERSQFGKPIGKFQAIQQNLAVFAEEAAAVNSAGQAAARALDRGEAAFEIACAKLRANRACGIGAAIAHQVHGAIGFTREHGLHRLTGPLPRWRTEFGGDRFWGERLGRSVCAAGADAFWPDLVRRGDRG